MKVKYFRLTTINRVKSLTKAETLLIKEIESDCQLSRWLISDYETEPHREDCVFLTAEIENKIVGFLITRILPAAANKSSGPAKLSESDLLNFGVLNRCRKQGIGKKLFEKLFQELSAVNVGTLWLEVRKSNENAIKFYLERNFQIVRSRKNFYADPDEDALVMKLELNEKKAELI